MKKPNSKQLSKREGFGVRGSKGDAVAFFWKSRKAAKSFTERYGGKVCQATLTIK